MMTITIKDLKLVYDLDRTLDVRVTTTDVVQHYALNKFGDISDPMLQAMDAYARKYPERMDKQVSACIQQQLSLRSLT
jgi:hypothetical protein